MGTVALFWLAVLQADPAAAAVVPSCPLPDAPIVEITAHVKMKSVRFSQRGETQARVWSEPGGEGEWKFDRGPLPDPIPVGKTFRDVEVDLRARADLTQDGLTVSAGAGPPPCEPPRP